GALTGLLLLLKAGYGASIARDVLVWNIHLFAGFAAVIIPLLLVLRTRSQPPRSLQVAASLPVLLLIMLGGACALLGTAAALPEYVAEDVYRDLTATNAVQAQNPHFPAGVRVLNPEGTRDRADPDWGASSS